MKYLNRFLWWLFRGYIKQQVDAEVRRRVKNYYKRHKPEATIVSQSPVEDLEKPNPERMTTTNVQDGVSYIISGGA